MKRLLLSLSLLASISAFGQTLSRSCTFDFTKPNSGGLSQNITPSSTNGGDVSVLGYTFISKDIQLTTDEDPNSSSRGARLFSFKNSVTNLWEYSLKVYSGTALVFEAQNNATIQSIQFGSASSMGGLQLESSQSDKGTFSNAEMLFTATSSNVDYLELRNRQSTPAKITTITVNYLLPTVSLEPTSVSLVDGSELESFDSLVLKYDCALTSASSTGITVSKDGSEVASTTTVSDSTVTIKVDKTIEYDGTVTIHIPAGSFVNSEGFQNTAKDFTYTIKAARNTFNHISVDPSTEKVIAELPTTFTLSYEKTADAVCIGHVNDQKYAYVWRKGEESPIATVKFSKDESDDSKVIITMNDGKTRTTAGTYTIEIPEKVIYNRQGQYDSNGKWVVDETYGRWNKADTLTYVVGEVEPEPIPDSETLTKAKELLNLTGVGYPSTSSTAYTELSALVNSETTPSDDALQAKIDAFYSETNITLPATDSYYKIASVNTADGKLYLAYDGTKVSLSSNSEDAATFKATLNSDNTVTLATTDGKYLHVLTAGGYDATSSSNVTSGLGQVNLLTIGKLVSSDNAETALGKVTIYGLLGKQLSDPNAQETSAYAEIQYPSSNIYNESDVHFTETLSSAFVFETAETPVTPTEEVELAYELTSSKDSNGNIILTLTFTDTDAVVTSYSTAGEYIEDANGNQTMLKMTQSATESNVFSVNMGSLANGTYTLVIPGKNLLCTKNGTTSYVSKITKEFTVNDGGTIVNPTGNFSYTYNSFQTLLDPSVAHYDTDLNDFVIYTTLYDDMAPSSNVVQLVRSDDASDIIRQGVFERYTGTDLPSGAYGLKLRFTDGKGDITLGELKSDRYSFIFQSATWGDSNFAKYLAGESIDESECKVNTRMISTFVVDNEAAAGISNIYTDDNKEQVIYDITGRKLQSADKPGLYIINGKKVIRR